MGEADVVAVRVVESVDDAVDLGGLGLDVGGGTVGRGVELGVWLVGVIGGTTDGTTGVLVGGPEVALVGVVEDGAVEVPVPVPAGGSAPAPGGA